MARLRLYGRDSFVDERLLDARGLPCSRDARLVLMALKPIADREGRLEDRPQKIRLDVFPSDLDLDVDGCLTELASLPTPAVLRYEVAGQRCLQIMVWDQKPHANEVPSKLPPPPKPGNAPKQQPSGTIASAPEGSGMLANTHEPSGQLGEVPERSRPIDNPDPVPVPDPITAVVVDDVRPGDVEPTDDNGPRLVQCPRCKSPLRRERGFYASDVTAGKGWLCGPARTFPGACGAVFKRDAPEVLAQLSDGARAALEREIRDEREARSKLLAEVQRAEELAAEFIEHGRGRRYANAPAESAEATWQRISDRLRSGDDPMDQHSHGMWIRPTWGLQLAGAQLVVVVPSPLFVDWLHTGKYSGAVAAAGELELGPDFAVTYRAEGEVLLERFHAWAQERKLKGPEKLATLAAIQRRLGVEAA